MGFGPCGFDPRSRHRHYLRSQRTTHSPHSLVDAALADGVVSASERRDLEAAAKLLAVDPSGMQAMLLDEHGVEA